MVREPDRLINFVFPRNSITHIVSVRQLGECVFRHVCCERVYLSGNLLCKSSRKLLGCLLET